MAYIRGTRFPVPLSTPPAIIAPQMEPTVDPTLPGSLVGSSATPRIKLGPRAFELITDDTRTRWGEQTVWESGDKMASSVPKPMLHGRRLFELLEEQQEPFLLDVYLLEHGYSDRAMNPSAAAFMCWHGGACRRLRRFSTHGCRRKRSGLLRCLLNKVVYGKVIRKAWRWDGGAIGIGRWNVFRSLFEMKGKSNAVEFRRLSCSCGTDEGDPEREEQWRAMGGSDQRSPVSVLELHSDEVEEEVPSTSGFDSPKDTKEAPWIGLEEHPNTRNQFLHPRRFLSDWLKEVEGRLSTPHECPSPERSGKVTKEGTMILSWENRGCALGNISRLIDFDFSESRKEWSHFRHEIGEVGTEIEQIIFEEISEEAVLDVLRCHSTSETC
ncbi:hypothetical protein GW17_00032636 [Ensete ventricosum]|nr:hypothetical protein GW17_00032636 [Ensete ventricosum]